MLHKINIPDCREYCEWITNLQYRILRALCAVNANDVTEAWVIKQLTDLDANWARKFCLYKDAITNSKQTVLTHMQSIAGFDTAIKQDILNAFENDIRIEVAFDGTSQTPFKLIGVTGLSGQAEVLAVRGFFEIFYAPAFYKNAGYFISLPDNDPKHFHRDAFINDYRRANDDLRVCPMCDGNLGEPEVDHFYPKKKYPTLSCHYLNLVPICSNCNSRSAKGEKMAATLTATDPFEDWFHPYLRPANNNFDLHFERSGSEPILVFHNHDPKQQTRLNNMTELIGLQERWKRELSNRIKATIKKIKKQREILDSRQALVKKLNEWAEDKECELGLIPFSILERSYLLSASKEHPETFDELWIVASGADPVTAQIS